MVQNIQRCSKIKEGTEATECVRSSFKRPFGSRVSRWPLDKRAFGGEALEGEERAGGDGQVRRSQGCPMFAASLCRAGRGGGGGGSFRSGLPSTLLVVKVGVGFG